MLLAFNLRRIYITGLAFNNIRAEKIASLDYVLVGSIFNVQPLNSDSEETKPQAGFL